MDVLARSLATSSVRAFSETRLRADAQVRARTAALADADLPAAAALVNDVGRTLLHCAAAGGGDGDAAATVERLLLAGFAVNARDTVRGSLEGTCMRVLACVFVCLCVHVCMYE